MTKPLNFLHSKGAQTPEEKENLLALAEKTEQFALTAEEREQIAACLYRIDLLRERTRKSFFTAGELAEQLNLSMRGASRLLNALEEHDLAALTGQTVSGKAGRPSNIYQILFDLD